MSRPALEVADIFRGHGPAWPQANASHVSFGQLKVMSAIENCRTAALGGHVARCENEKCAYTQIAYNSFVWGFICQALSLLFLESLTACAWPKGRGRSTARVRRALARSDHCASNPRGACHWAQSIARDLVFGWIRIGPGP